MVFSGGGYPTSLWLASVDEASPVQLMAVAPDSLAYLTYSVSADGSRAAVAVNYLDAEPWCCVEESASLYLLDLENLGEPILIDSTSGNANGFQYAWSPTGHGLLYQRWLRNRVDDSPNGPVQLLGDDGRSQLVWEGARARAPAGWVFSTGLLNVIWKFTCLTWKHR